MRQVDCTKPNGRDRDDASTSGAPAPPGPNGGRPSPSRIGTVVTVRPSTRPAARNARSVAPLST
ncbi:MAG: hypothetical protein O9972_34335 [Burkholderiales bacterium]|nr:hypothetical protein [Burkholderiales bacterium]